MTRERVLARASTNVPRGVDPMSTPGRGSPRPTATPLTLPSLTIEALDRAARLRHEINSRARSAHQDVGARVTAECSLIGADPGGSRKGNNPRLGVVVTDGHRSYPLSHADPLAAQFPRGSRHRAFSEDPLMRPEGVALDILPNKAPDPRRHKPCKPRTMVDEEMAAQDEAERSRRPPGTLSPLREGPIQRQPQLSPWG